MFLPHLTALQWCHHVLRAAIKDRNLFVNDTYSARSEHAGSEPLDCLTSGIAACSFLKNHSSKQRYTLHCTSYGPEKPTKCLVDQKNDCYENRKGIHVLPPIYKESPAVHMKGLTRRGHHLIAAYNPHKHITSWCLMCTGELKNLPFTTVRFEEELWSPILFWATQ